MLVFFFQAEDGIRDDLVTGVQTCALPICARGWLPGDEAADRTVRPRWRDRRDRAGRVKDPADDVDGGRKRRLHDRGKSAARPTARGARVPLAGGAAPDP